MRRINLVFLATLQVCRARTRGFSIHEDLVAFPQFDIVFSEHFISPKDAQALVEDSAAHPTYSADFSPPTAGDIGEGHGTEAADSDDPPQYTYEIMNMTPHQYLCSIPVIQPPEPENKTASELARAEEARELARAAENGWELLKELEGICLYFMSGWWSYRFCNNQEIVQFHAIATLPNGQAPKPDPNSAEYVLGREPSLPTSMQQLGQHTPRDDPIPAELQVKGDQRYLVQKLVDGTICDLTGRPRTIEVQYHCAPGLKQDRISWIKEVTICAYVMMVNTPRLCNDVAFLPPKETKANPISCQLIVDKGAAETPLLDQSLPRKMQSTEKVVEEEEGKEQGLQGKVLGERPVIGGITVGARKVLSKADEAGKPPVKLEPPMSFYKKKKAVDQLTELVAKAASREDGGKLEMLSKEELEKLNVSPEDVEEIRKQMEKLAKGAGWKVEIVEIPGETRELHGYIDEDDEAGAKEGKAAAGGKKDTAGGQKKADDKEKKKKQPQQQPQADEEEAGSEEQFYKEEL
jgi:protein OS-9